MIQYPEGLLVGEHARQALFRTGAQELEERPFFSQNMNEEELDPAITDLHGRRLPLVHVPPVKKIVSQFFFGDLRGLFSMELNQHAHGAGVAFLGPVAHPGQLQRPNGFIAPRGVKNIGFHDASPFC